LPAGEEYHQRCLIRGPEFAIAVTTSGDRPADTGYRHSRIALDVINWSGSPSRRTAMNYREPELLPFLKNLYFLLLTVALGANVFPFI
jgi:hypothetical protein